MLIVGGAGYIGSVAAERLIESGHQVVVYDNLSQGHREAVHPAATLVVGDLADDAALDRVFREHPIDAVMQFAAFIQVGESMQDPARYFTNNVGGTLHLLNAMLRHDVRRLVFSSTAAVYGNQEPERMPLDETASLSPANPYGESKAMVERILDWHHRLVGLQYVALRYFNAAGATVERGEDHPVESHLIPLVLQAAMGRREHIAVFGEDYPTPDGTCIRDYVHVVDLVDAHMLALERLDRVSGRAYNLGNGAGYSVREVIATAEAVMGRPVPVIVGPRRFGDSAVLVASPQRAMDELGWRPRYGDLATIIGSAWEWQRRHPQGYAGSAC